MSIPAEPNVQRGTYLPPTERPVNSTRRDRWSKGRPRGSADISIDCCPTGSVPASSGSTASHPLPEQPLWPRWCGSS